MRILIYCCLLLIVSLSLTAQTFRGIIMDAEQDEGLPYANIGVVGQNIGGISQANGQFAIDVSDTYSEDSIKISYIGYYPVFLSVGNLDFEEDHRIRLVPEVYELSDIVVSAKSGFKELGNKKSSSRYTGWGDIRSSKGRARGLLIDGIECPSKIKQITFRLNHNDWDSVAFRVNFLKVDETGAPGESILRKNIFFHTADRKWINFSLDEYDIYACDEVIAVLEWVDAWKAEPSINNLLTFSLSKNDGKIYSKEPGEEVGSLTKTSEAPAIYIEVYSDKAH